jgi:hypothetical protein
MRHLLLPVVAFTTIWLCGCPNPTPADDDDTTGDDDDTTEPDPLTLDECMEATGLDFTCSTWAIETAVNGEVVGCSGAGLSDSEAFLTFWLADNDPDGTVHVLELRLQDPGWSTNNDGERWTITLDPPLALGDGDQLPATLTGSAVVDSFTMTASFSFLEAHLDVEVQVATQLTMQQLLDGAMLDATITGTGSDFLVFDGVDDSPDPLGDYEWIDDPTGEAFGCVHTAVTLHPLDIGDP